MARECVTSASLVLVRYTMGNYQSSGTRDECLLTKGYLPLHLPSPSPLPLPLSHSPSPPLPLFPLTLFLNLIAVAGGFPFSDTQQLTQMLVVHVNVISNEYEKVYLFLVINTKSDLILDASMFYILI